MSVKKDRKKKTEGRRCLNCDTLLNDGNYCHICGQPVSTGRLTTMNMGVNIVSGLTRINSTFLFTLTNLLLRPWMVISEFISGKRAKYVAPVQLLLVLIFIWIALPKLIGYETTSLAKLYEARVFLAGDNMVVTVVNFIFSHIITSETLMFVLLVFPAIPVIRLIHRMAGIRKFNMAEYIVSALYLSCFVLALSIVFFIPVAIYSHFVDTKGTEIVILKALLLLAVISVAIYKSFASSLKNIASKTGYVFATLVLSAMFYALLLVVGVLIHDISFHKI